MDRSAKPPAAFARRRHPADCGIDARDGLSPRPCDECPASLSGPARSRAPL